MRFGRRPFPSTNQASQRELHTWRDCVRTLVSVCSAQLRHAHNQSDPINTIRTQACQSKLILKNTSRTFNRRRLAPERRGSGPGYSRRPVWIGCRTRAELSSRSAYGYVLLAPGKRKLQWSGESFFAPRTISAYFALAGAVHWHRFMQWCSRRAEH